MSGRSLALVAVASVLGFVHAGPTRASSLTLNCTEYQNFNTPANCATGATPTNLSTPGAYAYFDTALQPDSSTGGIISGSMYPTTPPPGYPGALPLRLPAQPNLGCQCAPDLGMKRSAQPGLQGNSKPAYTQ